ncbi:MAG: CcmD family protein [Armatimonadetes bacterium]|nr:CcmD family protein [Armatimonadota bacterium]
MSNVTGLCIATLLIWGGIFAYLWSIERRLSRIEKKK